MAISVENRQFSHAEGVPLEYGTDAMGQKTRMMGLPGRQNSFTIGFAV